MTDPQATRIPRAAIAALSLSETEKPKRNQMTNNTANPTPPPNLDPSRLYSPAEVDQWKGAWADYRAAVRAEEDRERLKQQAAEARNNRDLTRDEYHQISVKREAENQAKQAAGQAAKQAEKDEEAAYLASLPEVAEVMEQSEFLFLTKLAHRLSQGYVVTEDSIRWWTPGLYHVVLNKPAAPKRK